MPRLHKEKLDEAERGGWRCARGHLSPPLTETRAGQSRAVDPCGALGLQDLRRVPPCLGVQETWRGVVSGVHARRQPWGRAVPRLPPQTHGAQAVFVGREEGRESGSHFQIWN